MLGDRLHQARKACGLSLRALSERVGVTAMMLSKYERDESVPSSDVLIDLSDALGVRVEYFFRTADVTLERVQHRNKHRWKLPKRAEEEVLAASLRDSGQLMTSRHEVSSPEIKGNLDRAIANILAKGIDVLIVKRGAKGCSIFKQGQQEVKVPGFPVEVLSVLGAGDAFAGGLTYGFLQGWDWYKACRMGNACGAIVVMRHGCSNFMPTPEEVFNFVDEQGTHLI